MIKRNLLLGTLILAFLTSCSQKQNKEAEMRQTSKKLIDFLLKSDTASISALIINDYNRNNKFDENLNNARTFRKVTGKYGVPSEKDLQLSKGERGENVLSVPIMAQVDSSLNIQKAILYIAFYPDQYLSDTKTILDYGLVTISVKELDRKLIIAPTYTSPTSNKKTQ